MSDLAQEGSTGREADEVDLRQVLGHLLEKRWLIAGCVGFCLLAGLVYLKITPPVFEATTLVEVQQSQNIARFEDYQDQDSGGDEVVKTLERLFQRDSLYRRVMGRREIRENADLQQSLGKLAHSNDLREQGELLKEWTQVRLEKGTRLISVSVQHTKPPVARELATMIVDEFLREKEDLRSKSWVSALDELAGEEDRAGKNLTDSQSTLQGLEALTGIHEKIEAQKDEIADLRKSYQDEHPEMRKARDLLAKLYGDLEKKIAKVKPHLLGKDDQNGKSQSRSTDEELDAEYERLIPYHPEISVQVEKDRAVFDSILQSRREIDVTMRLAATPIVIVEDAFEPGEPVKPDKLRVLAASIFLGGGLGLALAWGLRAVDRSIRTIDDAERVVGLPVLGMVFEDSRLPDFQRLKDLGERDLDGLKERFATAHVSPETQPRRTPKGVLEPLVLASDPGGSIAEGFRSMRAMLILTGRSTQRGHKSFLVTSAVPDEGKSFVAANLALAFSSQKGERTLLIDANLRKPVIDTLFGVGSGREGLVETLASGGDWDENILESGFAGLDLLPAGGPTVNPAELLSSPSVQRFFQNLGEHYDKIILDSAPVNPVADALMLASFVDSAVLVVRAGDTPQEAVIRACELLERVEKMPLGLVLNRLPTKAGMSTRPHMYHDVAGKEYGDNYG